MTRLEAHTPSIEPPRTSGEADAADGLTALEQLEGANASGPGDKQRVARVKARTKAVLERVASSAAGVTPRPAV